MFGVDWTRLLDGSDGGARPATVEDTSTPLGFGSASVSWLLGLRLWSVSILHGLGWPCAKEKKIRTKVGIARAFKENRCNRGTQARRQHSHIPPTCLARKATASSTTGWFVAVSCDVLRARSQCHDGEGTASDCFRDLRLS